MSRELDHSLFCVPFLHAIRRYHRTRECPQNAHKISAFLDRFNLPLSVLGAQSGAFGGHENKLETAMNTVGFQHEMQVAGGNNRRVHVVSESVAAIATEQKIFHRQIELARALRDYLH